MKLGNKVVMHTCGEAKFPKNIGKIFTVDSNVFDVCGTDCVTILYEGEQTIRYRSFAVEYLALVDLSMIRVEGE